MKSKAIFISTLTGFVAPIIVAFIYNFNKIPPLPLPEKKIEISIKSHYNHQLVNEKETITVEAKNIHDGQKIWIVVHPHESLLYFPNICSASIDVTNRMWTSPDTPIGDNSDSGKKFDVYALLTDYHTQNSLNLYAINPESAGLSSLPSGMYAKITVIRKRQP